jgi:hypothetical protein
VLVVRAPEGPSFSHGGGGCRGDGSDYSVEAWGKDGQWCGEKWTRPSHIKRTSKRLTFNALALKSGAAPTSTGAQKA